MGKNTNSKRYEIEIQLLVVTAAVLTPFLAFSMMEGMELFRVSKSMFITLWSSINPWLCPPYVYIFINFIILFIFASSKSILYHSTNDDSDLFVESSLAADDHEIKFHTFQDSYYQTPSPTGLTTMIDDENHNYTKAKTSIKEKVPILEGTFNDHDSYKTVSKEVDKRELRKAKTFHEGGSSSRGRRERYVRILTQEELDRQVEAFIYKFKNVNK